MQHCHGAKERWLTAFQGSSGRRNLGKQQWAHLPAITIAPRTDYSDTPLQFVDALFGDSSTTSDRRHSGSTTTTAYITREKELRDKLLTVIEARCGSDSLREKKDLAELQIYISQK